MNEMDVLDLFYDELRAQGQTRNTLFISLDEAALSKLQQKIEGAIRLEDLHKYTDICIANEWLERTTILEFGQNRMKTPSCSSVQKIKT